MFNNIDDLIYDKLEFILENMGNVDIVVGILGITYKEYLHIDDLPIRKKIRVLNIMKDFIGVNYE